MKHAARLIAAALVLIVSLAVLAVSVETQGRGRDPLRLSASSPRDVRAWDLRITRMERDGTLRVRKEVADTLVPGRKLVRLDQFHDGVPVWGGEVVVETDGKITLSVLTNLHEDVSVASQPALTPEAAKAAIERLGGAMLGPDRLPKLVVYPLAGGTYRLAYTERVATTRDVRRFFIDANTGNRLDDFSELLRQSPAVGSGTGVMGDTKKISTTFSGGVYIADDSLRPPWFRTYDMQGDLSRFTNWLNGTAELVPSYIANDSDNVWTDGAAVDAHVYTGWAYDFFYKRFGRKGLDDNNSRVLNIVHPVRRGDLNSWVSSGRFEDVEDYYVNAAYWGGGVFVYGEGLPEGRTYYGQTYNYFAGALDIVGHEYTHGVTANSSRLGHTGEPRSLNEAFSDMMAASVEFYFRTGGANYTFGDKVVSGAFRSLSDPMSCGDVDNYSKRKPAVGYEYANSTIASHAFYLAIEGGTNRTSGRTVQGVGAANREQIEKAFYRGFTSLTSQATFAMARERTIQSAQVLYGSDSAAARAVTEAWTAVGVF